jgi:hypothetical protein
MCKIVTIAVYPNRTFMKTIIYPIKALESKSKNLKVEWTTRNYVSPTVTISPCNNTVYLLFPMNNGTLGKYVCLNTPEGTAERSRRHPSTAATHKTLSVHTNIGGYWLFVRRGGKFTVVIIYFLQFILMFKAVAEIKGNTFHKHSVHTSSTVAVFSKDELSLFNKGRI